MRLVGGDLARTLGFSAGTVDADDGVLELPIDVMEVTADGVEHVACAHVVAKPPSHRGGWWIGPLAVVMNAQFRGAWDVAPRGHPNDGRVEVLEVADGLSIRERLAVRRRLLVGTHLPHPAIRTRSVRTATFEFARPMALQVDGVSVGTARSMSVRVRADAVRAYV